MIKINYFCITSTIKTDLKGPHKTLVYYGK